MNLEKPVQVMCERLQGLGGLASGDSRVSLVTEGKIALSVLDAMYKGHFRRGDNTLYAFTGQKYEKLEDRDIKSFICEILNKLEIGIVYQMNSVSKIFSRIMNDMNIPEFKPSRSMISMRNGVLDLDTMNFSKHDERFMTRVYLEFDYAPADPCHLWKTILSEIVSDEMSVKVLQEFLGLVFVDRDVVNVEACLFLYGTGANGKSVVETTVKNMLGDNCSSHEISQLCVGRDADYFTVIANGKLLNFAPDMGDKDFSGGRYKAIVSHQPIMVRPIGMPPFEARDMPLLAASVNKMPVTSDSSDGYWRRNKVIIFDKTFEEKDQDKLLKSKLKKEMSGIFNWIMDGRARIVAQKGQFTDSEKMSHTVAKLRIDSNSVLSFIKDSGYTGKLKKNEMGVEVQMFSVDIMNEYKEYCRLWNNIPKSRNNMRADLLQAGFEYRDRMRITNRVSNGYVFYKIDPDTGDEIGLIERQAEEDYMFGKDNELPF